MKKKVEKQIMDLKDLVDNADKYARGEIALYNVPIPDHYEIAMKKGIELAKKRNADIAIVKIGIALMDCELGKAHKNGVQEKHIDMSVEKTKEILKSYNLDEEIKVKIINCVAAHHGTIPYLSIEAEICANADCYRFLHPRGFLAGVNLFFNRSNDLDKALEQVENKMKEKYNIMSLDIVKEELEEYYQQLKNILKNSKNNN